MKTYEIAFNTINENFQIMTINATRYYVDNNTTEFYIDEKKSSEKVFEAMNDKILWIRLQK